MQLFRLNLDGINGILLDALKLREMAKSNKLCTITKRLSENETISIFDSVIILKRIYGILYEISQLTNGNCGISSLFAIIFIIIGKIISLQFY
jgi:hypothetical protein